MFSPSSGSLNSAGTGRGWQRSAAGADAAELRELERGFAAAGFAAGGFGSAGLRLDGALVSTALGFRARAIFHREDHLADFDLLAFFDPNFLDCAGHRRWNFDDGLVGFQFHHRLAFGDAGARRNHQPHQITLIDVFAEFRKLEFSH